MAYTGTTAVERLAAVRASIDRVLNAQEWHGRGRGQVNAELRQLRELEKDLMQEVEDESGGGSMASLSIQTRLT